ncbi:MAG: hypothetical protein ACI814_005159 [Mariniblastus sp.]|jgi:hypothetical protein
MAENAYARRLNRFSKELIDALAQADDVLNFDAAKTARLFREWRATLSGVPAAESLLEFWATVLSEWTASGTDFRTALDRLSDTLRGCAAQFDPKRHVFGLAIKLIWSLDLQENGESTSIQSIQKLRDVERNVKLLLNHNNEGDELDRLIRPDVDGVLATIAEILNDRDLQRIDGAAYLLSSIDESAFRSFLEDPIHAAGLRELLTSVLVNLHDECEDLQPIELTVVKEANQKSRLQDLPETPLKRTPEDWDVRMELEAKEGKLGSSASATELTSNVAIRKIQPMEILCLKALRKLRAKSARTRKTRDQIAKSIDESYSGTNIGNAIAALSRDGLVDTLKHRPPKGLPAGCFITKAGLVALKKEASETKG